MSSLPAASLAHDSALAHLWSDLTAAPRRALCLLVYIEADYTRFAWEAIPVSDRVRLIGAMRVLSDIAVDCALALDRARQSLEAHSRG